MLINIGIMNEQGERKQLKVNPCSKVKYILQKYLQVSEECAGDAQQIEGDNYDEDDLDLFCLVKRGEFEPLPMEKNMKKLDIKDGDELIVYDNEALEQLQKSQNSTIITIIPEKGDSIKLIMKDEETMKDATRKALQQIKGNTFKEAFCTLYSLVPEDEDARYEDDYLIRDCKRNNTVRFNRLGRKGA